VVRLYTTCCRRKWIPSLHVTAPLPIKIQMLMGSATIALSRPLGCYLAEGQFDSPVHKVVRNDIPMSYLLDLKHFDILRSRPPSNPPDPFIVDSVPKPCSRLLASPYYCSPRSRLISILNPQSRYSHSKKALAKFMHTLPSHPAFPLRWTVAGMLLVSISCTFKSTPSRDL